MKILSAAQIRALDAYTIAQRPIASLDLMERAAQACVDWIVPRFAAKPQACIVCGMGNNGGDGLAIARLLHAQHWQVQVYIAKHRSSGSPDFEANLARLPVSVQWLEEESMMPQLPQEGILIDALLGAGLQQEVAGFLKNLLVHLNQSTVPKIAIDLPSGLASEPQQRTQTALRATHTLCFQLPKLAFFFPENEDFVGQWHLLDIGLSADFIAAAESPYHFNSAADMQALYRPRKAFAHKGSFGHALLIAGSIGKMGAALLNAKACLRAGAGLATLHIPQSGLTIAQTALWEAMVNLDPHPAYWTEVPELSPYKSIAVGSGIGQEAASAQALRSLLQNSPVPLVLDADALNILAAHPDYWALLPAGSILTPHLKELERLVGASAHSPERLQKTLQRAAAHQVYIIVKGRYSALCSPEGRVYFNSTGNAGMATAGSGDVLTGILAALLAQAYASQEAALLGMYLHGLAGDIALERQGSMEGIIASDLIACLPEAFRRLAAPT
jgi:NAD(P)H-hydrate epimerase